MWVKRLVVKNIRSLEHLDVTLERGLIGVFGKNGSGKSTFVDAMYALITNDFSRFDGVKADQIRNTAGPRDEASIYGEIEHDGHKILLYRGLRPAKHSLRVDDEPIITTADKIAERLTEVLGLDAKLLDLFVFKSQDQIYDFISSTDAERKKAFQALSRTEFCEDLWTIVGDSLNGDVDLNTVVEDNSDELLGKIGTLEADIATLTESREQWEARRLPAERKATAEAILRKRERWTSLTSDEEREAAKFETVKDDLAKTQSVQRKREAELASLLQDYADIKRAGQQAEVQLELHGKYKKQQEHAAELLDEKQELEAEAKTHPAPVPPESYSKASKQQAQHDKLSRELEQAKIVVAAFEEDGTVQCPTCGTSVEHLADHLAACREMVASYPERIAALRKSLDAAAAYDKAVVAHAKWQTGWDARVAANKKAITASAGAVAFSGCFETLRAAVDALTERDTAISTARTQLTTRTSKTATAQADHDACQRRLAELRSSISDNVVSDDKLAKAKRRLDRHTQAGLEIANIDGQLTGKREQLKTITSDLDKLKARLKRTKRLRKMAKVLERAREVLHRDCLPNRVSQINLARMEGDVNAGLEYFGSPFWVETDENLQFLIHKPGEPAQRAGQLSTGLRVVLAIPFWLAVASLWKNEIGMLTLDEPTANLDEDNRAFLAEALSCLTAKMRGSRQIIMVTHADNLKSAFTQVVEIG